MLTIKLTDSNRSIYGPLYINNIQRLATATSIKFIDENHLCVSNLVGKYLNLYHIDFNTNTYNILDTIDTTYNGELVITDLLDYDQNNTLITSNFDKGTQTLYKIINNKF